MNQPLRFIPLINLQLTRGYAKGVKNILRNKYPYRNQDGTYMEYNESITIVPKEFEKQGILTPLLTNISSINNNSIQ